MKSYTRKGLDLEGWRTCPKPLTNPPQYQVFVKLTWHRFLDYIGKAGLKGIVKSIRTLPKAFILFQLNLCHTILYWGNQAESSFFPLPPTPSALLLPLPHPLSLPPLSWFLFLSLSKAGLTGRLFNFSVSIGACCSLTPAYQ